MQRILDWIVGRPEPDPHRVEDTERRVRRLTEELRVYREGRR